MKGKYPCPKCGSNNWEPILWVEGEPYDECKKCGYHFTSKDVPKKNIKNTNTMIAEKQKLSSIVREQYPTSPALANSIQSLESQIVKLQEQINGDMITFNKLEGILQKTVKRAESVGKQLVEEKECHQQTLEAGKYLYNENQKLMQMVKSIGVEIRRLKKEPNQTIKVEYAYYVCQECGYTSGSSDFAKISQTQYDYDVGFFCPKCHSIDVKKRVGMADVPIPSPKIEELIRKSQEFSRVDV
jgi:Zn finger protein HypA/HybF involved in hydrogenase expression